MSRLHAVLLTLVSLCSLSLLAQTPDTAVLTGTVTDPTHALLPGAHVVAINELTGIVRTTQTDADGHFVLSGLPAAGLYDVVVSREGFANARVQHVDLAGGTSA